MAESHSCHCQGIIILDQFFNLGSGTRDDTLLAYPDRLIERSLSFAIRILNLRLDNNSNSKFLFCSCCQKFNGDARSSRLRRAWGRVVERYFVNLKKYPFPRCRWMFLTKNSRCLPIGGSWYFRLVSCDAENVYAMIQVCKPIGKSDVSFYPVQRWVLFTAEVK